ncbi:MAG: hypothetical protein ACYDCL_19115, partial [Myxococcales bacterium]
MPLALALLLAAPAASGSVDFACGCAPTACEQVRHGVWLLHSFWYEEARRTFLAAEGADPRCSAAFWGEAMTYDHPLWAPPGEADLAAGLAAAKRAVALSARGSKERGYAEAALALYDGPPARGAGAGTRLAMPSGWGATERAGAYLERLRALVAGFPGV